MPSVPVFENGKMSDLFKNLRGKNPIQTLTLIKLLSLVRYSNENRAGGIFLETSPIPLLSRTALGVIKKNVFDQNEELTY